MFKPFSIFSVWRGEGVCWRGEGDGGKGILLRL